MPHPVRLGEKGSGGGQRGEVKHLGSVGIAQHQRIEPFGRALRAGTVSINCYSEGDMTTPFGGYKESGFAGRDKSIFAHEQYTELKTIWMQLT